LPKLWDGIYTDMNNKKTEQKSKTAVVYPGQCSGEITIPPSKSFAHRAIICAALAEGVSHISNVAYSEDIKATVACMRKLGAEITEDGDTLTVNGVGFRSAIERNVMNNTVIDCNESGSTLRFLIPVFALSDKHCRFTGKGRLMQRPQDVYAEIFAAQNKDFKVSAEYVETFETLTADIFEVRGNVSSQFISGLLFALPLLDGDSIIKILPPFESKSYVDLTLEMLHKFGIETIWLNDSTLMVRGEQTYTACDYRVEGDYSQLAFFGVLAAVNNDLTVKGVELKSDQGDRAVIDILKNFGAKIKTVQNGYKITRNSLTAHEIDLQNCPDLGPVLMVLAALSEGTTIIKNAGRLRIKESDRIAAMETELKKAGVDISSTFDTVTVKGGISNRQKLIADSHNDHRIAMSMAVLATVMTEPVTIDHAEAINKSYPNFFKDLQKTGIKVEYN
jgi:3-phosphoshikimate 1-carboxyvinyltransferase